MRNSRNSRTVLCVFLSVALVPGATAEAASPATKASARVKAKVKARGGTDIRVACKTVGRGQLLCNVRYASRAGRSCRDNNVRVKGKQILGLNAKCATPPATPVPPSTPPPPATPAPPSTPPPPPPTTTLPPAVGGPPPAGSTPGAPPVPGLRSADQHLRRSGVVRAPSTARASAYLQRYNCGDLSTSGSGGTFFWSDCGLLGDSYLADGSGPYYFFYYQWVFVPFGVIGPNPGSPYFIWYVWDGGSAQWLFYIQGFGA